MAAGPANIGSEVVDGDRLLEILSLHLDRLGDEPATDERRAARAALAAPAAKRFAGLDGRAIGDVYEALLASRRGRRRRRSALGAFYTPRAHVDYMVGRLGLTRASRVLDPCAGAGHFAEALHDALVAAHARAGADPGAARRHVIEHQLYATDVDGLAAALTAVRLLLRGGEPAAATPAPNVFVRDVLLHSPERLGPQPTPLDRLRFDAIVGNPPYGARRPDGTRATYHRRYGRSARARRHGSVATGDGDSYAMFFANGIERLREGGRLCLITNDSFRSLATHAALRRHILDRCKIVEILLTDTGGFDGVSFKFAGMAITTLEKCSDPDARRAHRMRLVDRVRDPVKFAAPPPERVSELRQAEYERLPGTPFVVGVPRDVFESAARSGRVRDVARGRQGLATADDRRFLAGVGEHAPDLPRRIAAADLACDLTATERRHGAPPGRPHWVAFAKGEGFGDYHRPVGVAVDWSQESVAELERRARAPAGTPRRPRLQNRAHWFRPGLTYSVVSSGRLSVRLLPEGCIFGHKGSAIFVEDDSVSELFLLGYLNSALATYFMKRVVNTTATADVGYVERLPFRRPPRAVAEHVAARTAAIVERLAADASADVSGLRREIDAAILDLFEIDASRALVLRFHETVGRSDVEYAPGHGPGRHLPADRRRAARRLDGPHAGPAHP
jgi:hypothetical protein